MDLPGIRFDLEAIRHALLALQMKDGCTVDEVLEILTSAYCSQSQVGLNKPKHAQVVMLSGGGKVQVGKTRYQAVAVIKVCQDGARKYFAPITAFHATEAKVRSIS